MCLLCADLPANTEGDKLHIVRHDYWEETHVLVFKVGWKNGLFQEHMDLELVYHGILSILLSHFLTLQFTWHTIPLHICFKMETCMGKTPL